MHPLRTVVYAIVAVTTVGISPAGGGILGPSKASQLVTLRSSGAQCPVIPSPGVLAIDQMHMGDGSVIPFASPPPKRTLIITSIEFVTVGGSTTTPVLFNLLRVAAGGGKSSVVVQTRTTGQASGIATASLNIPTGAVLFPETVLCFAAVVGETNNPNTNVTIQGYLAPNK